MLAKHKADLKTSFISSSINLKKFADCRTPEIALRMSEIIATKLKDGAPEDKIPVTPKEIAYIMGHPAIVDMISKVTAEQSTEVGTFKTGVTFSEGSSGESSMKKEKIDDLMLLQTRTPK